MDREADHTETVSVETPSGRLAGVRRGPIASFKGIPFARPPVGNLRWRLPEPAEPWAGTRDATAFAPTCPQAPTQLESLMGMAVGEQSEDCLYLDIWTPACDDARRPVMVWIYGGAFVLRCRQPRRLQRTQARRARRRCRHHQLPAGRVRIPGARPRERRPSAGLGAEGVADQILALDWVKRNIARFGGDPATDDLRRIGRRHERFDVAGVAAGARPLSQGDCAIGWSPYRPCSRIVWHAWPMRFWPRWDEAG